MNIICTACKTTIDSKNINVATDLAKCQSCGTIHKLSDLKSNAELGELLQPPKNSGIRLFNNRDRNIEISLPKMSPSIFDTSLLLFMVIGIIGITFLIARTGFQNTGMLVSLAIIIAILTYVAYSVLNALGELQTIIIGDEGIEIVKKRRFDTKSNSFLYTDIQSIKMSYMGSSPMAMLFNLRLMWRLQFLVFSPTKMPVVIDASPQTIYLLEDGEKQDKEWLMKFLTSIVERKK